MKLRDFHKLELPQEDMVDRPRRNYTKKEDKEKSSLSKKAFKQKRKQLQEEDYDYED